LVVDKERLLKVLIIELFIIFFIRFQIFEGLSFEEEKLLLKKKEEDEIIEYDETNLHEYENMLKDKRENTLDIFEIIEKGKTLWEV
jgi:hypothetical protein